MPPFGRVVTELGMKWSERGERLAVPGQPPGTTGFPGAAAADPQPQTYAQRQIAGLHAAGRSVDEIVSALGLSRATVEDYVKVLERKTTGQKFVWPPSASFSAPSRPPAQVTPAPPQVTPAPPQVTPAPAQVTPPGQQQALSPRQQEVLELLRAGLQPAQIAARLQLQLATVNRHLSSIRAVAGEDEVRKLLDQAAAKLAAARPDAPAQAGTASITPWWIAAAPPASEPQTAMKPVAGRPLPVRPGPTPRPPSSPPGGTVPAPRRARRRSTASVVLWLLILLVIIVAIGAIV